MSYCSWSSAERFLTTATTATRKIVIFFLSLSLPDRWLLHVRLFYNCTREWNEKNTAFTRNFWRYLNADAVGVAMCVGFLFFFFLSNTLFKQIHRRTRRELNQHTRVFIQTHVWRTLANYCGDVLHILFETSLLKHVVHSNFQYYTCTAVASVLFVFDFFSRLSRRKNNIAPTVLL